MLRFRKLESQVTTKQLNKLCHQFSNRYSFLPRPVMNSLISVSIDITNIISKRYRDVQVVCGVVSYEPHSTGKTSVIRYIFIKFFSSFEYNYNSEVYATIHKFNLASSMNQRTSKSIDQHFGVRRSKPFRLSYYRPKQGECRLELTLFFLSIGKYERNKDA